MIPVRWSALVLVVSAWLAGCAGLPAGGPSPDVGIDGVACVGTPPADVPGLVPAANPALQARAQLASGQGGVCAARVLAVPLAAQVPVIVYRVYDSSNPRSLYGSWWALTRPTGPRDDYRVRNAICKEWSALDRLHACQLKPGTEVVLGTTQDAGCQDGTRYAKTADVQVYLPNDAKNGVLHVEHCREEGDWP